jgi:hypothetical protein
MLLHNPFESLSWRTCAAAEARVAVQERSQLVRRELERHDLLGPHQRPRAHEEVELLRVRLVGLGHDLVEEHDRGERRRAGEAVLGPVMLWHQ